MIYKVVPRVSPQETEQRVDTTHVGFLSFCLSQIQTETCSTSRSLVACLTPSCKNTLHHQHILSGQNKLASLLVCPCSVFLPKEDAVGGREEERVGERRRVLARGCWQAAIVTQFCNRSVGDTVSMAGVPSFL